MSGETVEESVVETPSNEVVEESTQPQVSAEDFAALKLQLDKQTVLIEKLREHEQSSLQREQDAIAARTGVEGELDALENKFNKQLEGVLIDTAVEKELTLAGARNVEVAKRLIDTQNIKVVGGKADSSAILDSINSLKESESYMFKGDAENENPLKPTSAPVARAGEPANEDVVNKELRAATNIDDLKAIIEKHNIKH